MSPTGDPEATGAAEGQAQPVGPSVRPVAHEERGTASRREGRPAPAPSAGSTATRARGGLPEPGAVRAAPPTGAETPSALPMAAHGCPLPAEVQAAAPI